MNKRQNYLEGPKEFVEICFAYSSLLAYIYALHDSYKALQSHVEKVDLIFYKYESWSDLDTIQISGLYITYLELFVGLRWCLRTLFLGDKIQKKKSIFSNDIQEDFRNLEKDTPVVDKIFWELRNEIHHSQLAFLQPRKWLIAGGGRKEAEKVAGLFLPRPKNLRNQRIKEEARNFYIYNSSSEMEEVRFIDALNMHYDSITEFHDAALQMIQTYSEKKFNRSIETRLQNFWALIPRESNT